MEIITTANVESAILFLLNCNKALFKTNLSEGISDFYEIAKEKYKNYLRLLLKQPDMGREEKIKQLVIMAQDMITAANQLAAQLTEDGLKQLFITLNKANREDNRALKPTLKKNSEDKVCI